MNSKRTFSDRFDWTLAFIMMLFCIVSVLAIASAQTSGQYGINFVPKQLFWYFVGACIVAVMMYFEPDQYKKMTWYLYGAGIFLLVALIFMPEGKGQIGEVVNGAKSWYHTPIGNIQPVPLCQIFIRKFKRANVKQKGIRIFYMPFFVPGEVVMAGIPFRMRSRPSI